MAGVAHNDRKRGSDFRRLALDYGINFWKVATEQEKKELFFKLAPNLIPRLHEGPGDNGEFLVKTTLVKFLSDDNTNEQSSSDRDTD